MIPDPTIDAIRRVRHEISRDAGHDLRKLKETFAKLEAQFERPVVDYGGHRTIQVTNEVNAVDIELLSGR